MVKRDIKQELEEARKKSSMSNQQLQELEEKERQEEGEGEKKGIFGLPKECPEMTKTKNSNEDLLAKIKNLNMEIEESNKSDFYQAFLRTNMFKTIREEVAEHQGRD